jgi:hypothetical protein
MSRIGETEGGEIGNCYFDPESNRPLAWDEIGKLKMDYLARVKKAKSVDEARPLAKGVQKALVSLGIREERAEDVVTKWTRSVFKDYQHAQPAQKPAPLDLAGVYFSFRTGGNPANVVDRIEARTRGDLLTLYRSSSDSGTFDSAAAVPGESFLIRGNQLLGPQPGIVADNGDIIWSGGYTSRKEPGPSIFQRGVALLVLFFAWFKAYSAQFAVKNQEDESSTACLANAN